MQNFGFGRETDRESTRMRFWLQLVDPALPQATIEVVADGTTEVERQPAQVFEDGRFRIDAEITAMPHEGTHPLLGSFRIDVDRDRPTHGVVWGNVDPQTGQPRIDILALAGSYFDVYFDVETALGVLTVDQAAHVVNHAVSQLFPNTPYTHQMKQALCQLIRKGVVGGPLARIAAGTHSKKEGDGDDNKDIGACDECAKPCCRVEAQGHCGRFTVDSKAGLSEQVIFVASQPGVARSPLGRGQVLVYVTVTNRGPQSVRLNWDGPPPGYAAPASAHQSSLLPPQNSTTLAIDRALKVVYEPLPELTGEEAHGDYVLSWCCPEAGRK